MKTIRLIRLGFLFLLCLFFLNYGCGSSHHIQKKINNSHKKYGKNKHGSRGKLFPQNKVKMYECQD